MASFGEERTREERSSLLFTVSDAAILAGDSNVHRIRRGIPEGSIVDCLPVSGAKFIHDVRDFCGQLQRKLEDADYGKVYLHLGSNDVLAQEETFYKKVTELCDAVHAMSPASTIVLCEILPRGPDKRRGVRKPYDNQQQQNRWIRLANNHLWDICRRVTYMSFLTYTGFSTTHHLGLDGLHLSAEGADMCATAVLEDVESLSCPEECPPEDFLTDDWPALPSTRHEESRQEVIPDIKMSYASVVESGGEHIPRTTRDGSGQGCGEMKRTRRATKRNIRYRKPTRKRYRSAPKKKLTRKQCPRNSPTFDPKESVKLEITADVAVLLKPKKIQGSYLRRRAYTVEETSCKIGASATNKKQSEKKKNPVQWLTCPDCPVRCSRDDFLLDHIIRRHTNQRHTNLQEMSLPYIEPTSANLNDVPVPEQPSDCPPGAQNKAEMLYCEGLYSIFPPSMWRSFHNMMMVGFLCGEAGLYHVMANLLLVQQDVDFARLQLLLSNDVEQNPGPTYQCHWELCTEKLENMPNFKFHVTEHVYKEKQCRWIGCSGCSETILERQVRHAVRHIYQTKEYFPTLEDWQSTLERKKCDEKTNLNICPLHLRSKLQLLFFDEDFN